MQEDEEEHSSRAETAKHQACRMARGWGGVQGWPLGGGGGKLRIGGGAGERGAQRLPAMHTPVPAILALLLELVGAGQVVLVLAETPGDWLKIHREGALFGTASDAGSGGGTALVSLVRPAISYDSV